MSVERPSIFSEQEQQESELHQEAYRLFEQYAEEHREHVDWEREKRIFHAVVKGRAYFVSVARAAKHKKAITNIFFVIGCIPMLLSFSGWLYFAKTGSLRFAFDIAKVAVYAAGIYIGFSLIERAPKAVDYFTVRRLRKKLVQSRQGA